MNKYLISFMGTLVLTAIMQTLLPWWIAMVCAVLVAFLVNTKIWIAYAAGFSATSSLWYIYALIQSTANQGVMAAQIADILSLPSVNYLYIITIFIGGLVGGIGALIGNLLKSTISPSKRTYKYVGYK